MNNYIKQIKVSNSVSFFKQKILDRFNLVEYYNNEEPAVWFGCYSVQDVEHIKENKSKKKILVWTGTDTLMYKPTRQMILPEEVDHITISPWTKETLRKKGIQSKLIPISPTLPISNPVEKGNSIYFYYGSIKRRKFYGGDIVDKIKSKINFKIIEADINSYDKEKIKEIYKKCFIGLRLAEHDGLSNTVLELGLMGRKCIHNGATPNSIHYNSVDDIVNKINIEYKNKEVKEIASAVKNYIDIDKEWLKI
jgi:hypothetical protein